MKQPTKPTGSSIQSKFKSLEDLTVEALREAILDSTYGPSEHLRERELARAFGVSTTPVKEALRRLEIEGLVYRVPLRGAYVTEDLASHLAEIGLLRACLEGLAAYLAAQKARAEDIEGLSVQIESMEQCTSRGDVIGAVESNERFHVLIHSIANNHFLKQMTTMLQSYDHSTRLRALTSESELARALLEHRAIYYAIADRNPQHAEARMREHVLRTMRNLDEKD